jgi:hypothetical protein
MMFASPFNHVPGHCIKLATTTSLHVCSCALSTDPIICCSSITVTANYPLILSSVAVASQSLPIPLLNLTPISTVFIQLFTVYCMNYNTLFVIRILSCPASCFSMSKYCLGIWFAMFYMFFKLVLFLLYFLQQKIVVGASNDLYLHSLAIRIRQVMLLCHKFM